MTFNLDGRVVAITGANRGLGRAFAEHLADHGAAVGLLARDEEDLALVVERIPTEAIGIKCDVTNPTQVATAFHTIAERFGQVDAAVANAGGQSVANRAEELSVESWREMVELNLTGAYITARAAYPYLRRSPAGRMIFVSSGAAKAPLTHMCAYTAAKAGVEGLVRALCVEWAKDGICVNAISPGLIENRASQEIPEKVRSKIVGKTALRRPGNTSDIVEPVLFLVGSESAYITGQTISVDGGYGLA